MGGGGGRRGKEKETRRREETARKELGPQETQAACWLECAPGPEGQHLNAALLLQPCDLGHATHTCSAPCLGSQWWQLHPSGSIVQGPAQEAPRYWKLLCLENIASGGPASARSCLRVRPGRGCGSGPTTPSAAPGPAAAPGRSLETQSLGPMQSVSTFPQVPRWTLYICQCELQESPRNIRRYPEPTRA